MIGATKSWGQAGASAISEAAAASKHAAVKAVKSEHEARLAKIFGDKKRGGKKGVHAITDAALKKADDALAPWKKAMKKKKAEKAFAGTIEHTKDAAAAYEQSKLMDKAATVNQRICASDVSGILSRFGYVAAAVSHLTSECRLFYDQRAYCAGDISRLFAGITMLASSSAEIAASCTEYKEFIGTDIAPYEFARRLKGDDVATLPVQEMLNSVDGFRTAHEKRVADKEARDFQLTVCVTASWFSATFFARFLDMTPAVKHCGKKADKHCAAAIIDIIASMSWTASSIAYAVTECPIDGDNQDAFCAAGITKLVAALADTSSALTVLAPTCMNMNATKPY